jgi:hypothetical protein
LILKNKQKVKIMKNKLLTTTALAGLLISGNAIAQTAITGNLDLSYKAITNTNTKASSVRGLGKESQINVTNKGKLNNGMDYVAGFSIEHDGAEGGSAVIDGTSTAATSGTRMFNENIYIDFIAGKTTLTIGADHIQNPDYEITNLTGTADLDEIISGVTAGAPAFITGVGSPYSDFGIGLIQDLGVGKFSVYYSPSGTTALAGDSHGGFATHQNSVDGANSKYEVGFRGDLGVKGFDLGLFYNSADSNDKATNSDSLDNYRVSLRNNFGTVTGAAQLAVQEALTGNAITQKKSVSAGLAYAISKDVSIGIAHGRTSDNATAAKKANDEKITTVSMGYSLGPVALGLSAGRVENYGNTASLEGRTVMFQAGTKF